MLDKIMVHGARENNLKQIDVEIPRDQLVVMTGLSGSGKSSLAFDTIFADGQRRYMESLSSYARQFLGQMEKPDVDDIEGLSPAISIDQKTTSNNPRSTVGTVTEIYDYLRLLYARVGIPHCPICGRVIAQQSVDEIVDQILSLESGTRIQLLAPMVREQKGTHEKVFEQAKKSGYVRVRVDGAIYDLSETISLDKNKKHSIEIVVDRLVIKSTIARRLTDSLETVLSLSGGLVLVDVVGGEPLLFSQRYACPEHGVSIESLEPRMFSFNSPFGACPHCTGLGVFSEVDPKQILPNPELSIQQGAFKAPGWLHDTGKAVFRAISDQYDIPLDKPVRDIPQEKLDVFLYGTGDEMISVDQKEVQFEGIIPNLQRRYRDGNEWIREEMRGLMQYVPCRVCHGNRLKPEILAVTVGGKNIIEFTDLSITEALSFVDTLSFSEMAETIARPILTEIRSRLEFLQNVGLDYLTLSRAAGTLSGGESQRIRLATQIGSHLMGVLYILDEPSIGLHQRDSEKLIASLKALRDLGNTVIVVEHDDDMIRAADYIVDIGPGAGIHGGNVVYTGNVAGLLDCKESLTGQYLSGARTIPVPEKRRPPDKGFLTIYGAREHNLKNIDVALPLSVFTCITGVSGSGKSSLINGILYPYLATKCNHARLTCGDFDRIEGDDAIDQVIYMDQSPIGRTPRSNPATYTGVFTEIRALFAETNEAKAKGYTAGRFSFNVKGGRCEACEGNGMLRIEMHFLPDVLVPCASCKGKRYNRETLAVTYRGKSIADVLEMTVEEAVAFFANHPKIVRRLQTLQDVGLGYIKLGQSATTLSGGEAQRVKLATELTKRATGKTLYLLDEPTTGLATADVHCLVDVLQRLLATGNTIVVIEHNLHVIQTADWIVDLGPNGGERGGTIVATGTPEEIAANPNSATGQCLKVYFDRKRNGNR